MDGENDIIKELNSKLTIMFIKTGLVPTDECLHEANLIFKSGKTVDEIEQILNRQFSYEVGPSFREEAKELSLFLLEKLGETQ